MSSLWGKILWIRISPIRLQCSIACSAMIGFCSIAKSMRVSWPRSVNSRNLKKMSVGCWIIQGKGSMGPGALFLRLTGARCKKFQGRACLLKLTWFSNLSMALFLSKFLYVVGPIWVFWAARGYSLPETPGNLWWCSLIKRIDLHGYKYFR